MLEKQRIKNAFEGAKFSYKTEAKVQKTMQNRLLELLKKHKSSIKSFLELGCGNGELCLKLHKIYEPNNYLAIDLVDFSQDFNNMGLKNTQFLQADFEHLRDLGLSSKFECIISNAALQWSDQVALLPQLHSLLKPNGILCFSTFGKDNYKQLRTQFNLGLNYLSLQDYTNLLKDFKILQTDNYTQTLTFPTALEVFRHCKSTGVNAIKQGFHLKKSDLQTYQKLFKNRLTYDCIFIIAQAKP